MPLKHSLTASAIMLLTMLSLNYISHVEEINPNKAFSTFPLEIGEWKGKPERFDQEIYDVLGVDDSILANYNHADGRTVQLYVGFYNSQSEGDLIHSPKHCMPGAGWNIIESGIVEVDIPESGSMNVIRLFLQKGVQKQISLYWFQSRGRIISSEYMQKIYLVTDSITRHRTDGSFVRLITPVYNDDEARAMERLKSFTRSIMPLLNEYIPS
ncbi:EpsI family protein [Desulfobacterales bacterium HSG16]|nr:EpsI family protein [Desulfobacterales bacterium HSG16]